MDAIYPRRCAICGGIVPRGNEKVCVACYEKLEVIWEPCCKKCGKPIEDLEAEYCFDCSRQEFYFEYGFSLWCYSDKMKKSIAQFKYHNRKEYASFYGEEFVKHFGEKLLDLQPDVLIPVPVHWTRYIQRGYNQAAVVAKKIGKYLDIPVEEDILVRTKKTIAQKQLNDRERVHNLSHAFSVSPKWKKSVNMLKKVVIVDDIYTTGSTINACARILKEHGVGEVFFIALCIGAGY